MFSFVKIIIVCIIICLHFQEQLKEVQPSQPQPTQNQTPVQYSNVNEISTEESSISNGTAQQPQQLTATEELGYEIEETNYSAIALYDYQACTYYVITSS